MRNCCQGCASSVMLSGRGFKRGKLWKGKVDPNAVTQEGKDQGEQKANLYLTKAECKKPKADKTGARSKVATKENSKTKYKSKIKVQLKHGKLKTKTYQTGQEHGQATTNRKQKTMTGQGVRGTQRLNTQTLMT